MKLLSGTAAALALLLSLPAAAGLPGVADPARLSLAAPDVEAALALDALRSGPQPYRFAVPIAVNVNPHTHGVWSVRDANTLVWRLTVNVHGARHLNFGFPDVSLPAGASLTLAAPDGTDLRGPYAGPRTGPLWTPIVRSDEVILELVVPAPERPFVALNLASVNYGFRGFGFKDETSQAKSGDCNVDVVCPEGDAWRNEIRSVARISISGAFLCTGTMLNNTAQDFTPYFLTAAHCLSTHAEALTTTFYWSYETSECGSRRPDGDLSQTSEGALLRASGSGSASLGSPFLGPDFALLELLERPPAEYRVFYSGWDNRDIAPHGVVGIHHPSGDEKRISFDFDQTELTNWSSGPGTTLSNARPTHLQVTDWDLGTTEQGSSGSGLWNMNHHLVGQLSGGSAACGNDSRDIYGRFHFDWHEVPTPATSVATWLDPLGTGAETLDGADPAGTGKSAAQFASGSGRALGGTLTTAATLVLLLGGLLRLRRR